MELLEVQQQQNRLQVELSGMIFKSHCSWDIDFLEQEGSCSIRKLQLLLFQNLAISTMIWNMLVLGNSCPQTVTSISKLLSLLSQPLLQNGCLMLFFLVYRKPVTKSQGFYKPCCRTWTYMQDSACQYKQAKLNLLFLVSSVFLVSDSDWWKFFFFKKQFIIF